MSNPIVSIMTATDKQSVTIPNGAAVPTTAIQMRDYSLGFVFIPDSWSAANMGFKVSHNGSTWWVLKDETGVPVQISTINATTGACYALPFKVFGAWYIIPWSKSTTATTETDVNQTGDKALTFLLKN